MRETSYYSEAAVEVLDILNYVEKSDIEKIPQSFINFLRDISNKNYKINLNHNIPISGLNLREQTRELLGFIYITWWANDEERKKYKKQIKSENLKNEEQIKQVKINEMFKDKNEYIVKNQVSSETKLVEYKEENIFRKILNKILKFFKGN